MIECLYHTIEWFDHSKKSALCKSPVKALKAHFEEKVHWALLLAKKFGWTPDRPSYYYLASDQDVPAEEAKSIYAALEELFNKTLSSPLDVYPLRVNMGGLSELKDFLEGGAFITKDF